MLSASAMLTARRTFTRPAPKTSSRRSLCPGLQVSDSTARAVLTLTGQAVGAAVGGPFGAAIGSAIGNAAGWWLFPEEIVSQGPRLSELSVQSSTLGLTIPVVYGSWRLAGNIIWSTDLIETRTERDAGGKGGPSQTAVEYSYRASFAVGPMLQYQRLNATLEWTEEV